MFRFSSLTKDLSQRPSYYKSLAITVDPQLMVAFASEVVTIVTCPHKSKAGATAITQKLHGMHSGRRQIPRPFIKAPLWEAFIIS